MISISRKDLYEMLWTVGISSTAKSLNVPYNKLKAACYSNDIPLPTASYWSSLRLGKKKPIQPLLPDPTNNLEITLPVVKSNVNSSVPEKMLLPTRERKNDIPPIKEGTSKIVTSDANGYFSYLKDEQPLLIKIYNSLRVNKTLSTNPHEEIVRYRKKNRGKFSYYPGEATLKIKSSSGVVIPEIFPFIDSLFKALEKAGARINITDDENQVLYKNYTFILTFRLPSKRVNLSPDDKEYSTYNTFKYVSTGKINVEVGYRVEWSNWLKGEKIITQNKRDTLDDLLKKVFLYVFSLPEKIDEEKKAYEVAEEQKRQEEEKRAILKERHDREYRRTDELLKKSIEFFYSKLVQEYVRTQLDESTDEYNWAMDKANWIKDSDKYPDKILTKEDKKRLIHSRSEKNSTSFFDSLFRI